MSASIFLLFLSGAGQPSFLPSYWPGVRAGPGIVALPCRNGILNGGALERFFDNEMRMTIIIVIWLEVEPMLLWLLGKCVSTEHILSPVLVFLRWGEYFEPSERALDCQKWLHVGGRWRLDTEGRRCDYKGETGAMEPWVAGWGQPLEG